MLSPPSLIHHGQSAHGGVYILLIVLLDYIYNSKLLAFNTQALWPNETHKPPAYKNFAHQPTNLNYNSFQNLVYNGVWPWGHYNMFYTEFLQFMLVYSFI
jgi:hypothetical protein